MTETQWYTLGAFFVVLGACGVAGLLLSMCGSRLGGRGDKLRAGKVRA